jgi:hypothetical protein
MKILKIKIWARTCFNVDRILSGSELGRGCIIRRINFAFLINGRTSFNVTVDIVENKKNPRLPKNYYSSSESKSNFLRVLWTLNCWTKSYEKTLHRRVVKQITKIH